MVVAQTGMGKTEAGLHWIGNNKGFFILPLKTAINSIYKRIKEDILDKNHIESKLALLHSDALSYYNNDKNDEMLVEFRSTICWCVDASRPLLRVSRSATRCWRNWSVWCTV